MMRKPYNMEAITAARDCALFLHNNRTALAKFIDCSEHQNYLMQFSHALLNSTEGIPNTIKHFWLFELERMYDMDADHVVPYRNLLQRLASMLG